MYQIDILLAVYNGEKFVSDQIHSILNQSFSSHRLLIRDNASEDNTCQIIQEIASKHEGRVSLTPSTTNDGVIGNFHALMKQAKAPYIMFSDADDVWLPEKIAKTMHLMKDLERKYGVDTPFLVHTDLTVVDRQLNVIHPSFRHYSHLQSHNHELPRQLVQNAITGCTVLINQSLLKLALPLPSEIVMHDWWLGLVASLMGKIGFLDEPTMLYRQHGGNDTGAKKYGFLSYYNRWSQPKEREKLISNRIKRFRQAEELLTRFENCSNPDQKELLKAYLECEKASFFKKRHNMIKHGFFKCGFLRNLAEFCFS